MAIKPTIEGILLSEVVHVEFLPDKAVPVKPGSFEEKANGVFFEGLTGQKHWVSSEALISVRNR